MDYRTFKTQINNFFLKYVGGQNRETYFDITQTYPALNKLTENYHLIRTEFEQIYSANTNMPLYHEIDPGESQISNTTDKNWKVFMLYLLGHKPKANRLACPQTCRLIDTIPNVIQAFFSVLEPQKSIPLHEGPYLGYLRYHLGIKVPSVNPPSLVVNNKPYVWKEGEGVLFDDSWPHAVTNQCNQTRVVLIIDILRPMPFFPTLVNKFMTSLLARYTYGRRVVTRIKRQQTQEAPVIN